MDVKLCAKEKTILVMFGKKKKKKVSNLLHTTSVQNTNCWHLQS